MHCDQKQWQFWNLTIRSMPLSILQKIVGCTRLLVLLIKFDWISGRARSIRLFWADTDVFIFFIADNWCRYLQHSNHSWKTILQYNQEAYNIEFCASLGHLHSQKPRPCSQATICLPHKIWECMFCHRPVYWDDCTVVWKLRTTWCSQRAARRKEQYREFALINHRRSSNLVSEHPVQKTNLAAFMS